MNNNDKTFWLYAKVYRPLGLSDDEIRELIAKKKAARNTPKTAEQLAATFVQYQDEQAVFGRFISLAQAGSEYLQFNS